MGIMFTVMREVEKEVVLLDPSPSSSSNNRPDSMKVDSNDLAVVASIPPSSLSRVLKVIKKLDVQILCTQHNPVCKYSFQLFIIISRIVVGCGCSEEGQQTG